MSFLAGAAVFVDPYKIVFNKRLMCSPDRGEPRKKGAEVICFNQQMTAVQVIGANRYLYQAIYP